MRTLLLFVLCVVIVTTFGIGTVMAAQYNFKLGHAAQPTHAFHLATALFADAVKAKTNGMVEITIYPSRQLGDDKAVMEGVQLGTLPMGSISTALFDLLTPRLNALRLPWVIRDYDMAQKIYGSPACFELISGLDQFGIKGLGVFEAGLMHVTSRKGTATSLEGLKGLKIRVAQTSLHLAVWKALGASPIPMAYGEVYTSLQTGVLDAAEMNLPSIYSEKYYEVAKYAILTGHCMWPGLIAINKKLFDSLPKEIQAKMEEAAKEVLPKQIQTVKEVEQRAASFLTEKGILMYKVEDLAPMIKAVEPVYKEYSGKDPAIAKFVDAVQRMK